MFGLSTFKLIGIGIAALFLLGLVAERSRWMHRAHAAEAKVTADCNATRIASNQPKLKCGDVPKQITFMGEAIGTLSAALDKQNAAVKAMGAETARQQAESAKASEKAKERADRAEATAERLAASSRSGGAAAKPCLPSKALQESWR